MKFYVLRHEDPPEINYVYVNREDFDDAVAEALDTARYGAPDDERKKDHEREEIERQVQARTRTCATLDEVDALADSVDETVGWTEAGRSHDGERGYWEDTDYRCGNGHLYRLAADSLRSAEDETMGYDQGSFHDMGLVQALSIDDIDPEARIVTKSMADAIAPCETAACVAGHVYVCARGWQDYLQACARANGDVPTPVIGDRAATELGMSARQQSALFPSLPELEEIVEAFGIAPGDWTRPPTEIEEIENRWQTDQEIAAEDMAVVLEAVAQRCDRVNALVAAIEN